MLRVSYALVSIFDVELPTLRNAELDALLDGVFSDYEADLERFPFRAHIFRRCGMFPCRMARDGLQLSNALDRSGSGDSLLSVLGAGRARDWCGRRVSRATSAIFGETMCQMPRRRFSCAGRQDSATREVFAILALPLRQLVDSDAGAASATPIGVLCFDALSAEAADGLGQLFVVFARAKHRRWRSWPTGQACMS